MGVLCTFLVREKELSSIFRRLMLLEGGNLGLICLTSFKFRSFLSKNEISLFLGVFRCMVSIIGLIISSLLIFGKRFPLIRFAMSYSSVVLGVKPGIEGLLYIYAATILPNRYFFRFFSKNFPSCNDFYVS